MMKSDQMIKKIRTFSIHIPNLKDYVKVTRYIPSK